uniref:Uncharacterized protein n=1 Tax=Plectus sambesii TaxID=2011161 RepID=A0A914VYJ8_9BILA
MAAVGKGRKAVVGESPTEGAGDTITTGAFSLGPCPAGLPGVAAADDGALEGSVTTLADQLRIATTTAFLWGNHSAATGVPVGAHHLLQFLPPNCTAALPLSTSQLSLAFNQAQLHAAFASSPLFATALQSPIQQPSTAIDGIAEVKEEPRSRAASIDRSSTLTSSLTSRSSMDPYAHAKRASPIDDRDSNASSAVKRARIALNGHPSSVIPSENLGKSFTPFHSHFTSLIPKQLK